MKCLACLLEIKLPHNKIRSILVLLGNLDCEMVENPEIRETSKKLSLKYATVLNMVNEESQSEKKDFVLLRISTVTVSSVTSSTTVIKQTT